MLGWAAGKNGMEGTHSMMTTTIIIDVCRSGRLSYVLVCGVGNGSWLGFCQLKWDIGVADLFGSTHSSITSHSSSLWLLLRTVCVATVRLCVMSRYCWHAKSTLWCALVLASLLCGVTALFVMVGVMGVCHGGCQWSNEGCGRWWWRKVGEWWWWGRKCLFVYDVDVSSWQTPLMQLSIKTGWCELLSNIKAEFVSHQFPLCFHVQALDPHLWHRPRKLGRASGAGHSLPGLDPLVLMFNPSSGTHL